MHQLSNGYASKQRGFTVCLQGPGYYQLLRITAAVVILLTCLMRVRFWLLIFDHASCMHLMYFIGFRWLRRSVCVGARPDGKQSWSTSKVTQNVLVTTDKCLDWTQRIKPIDISSNWEYFKGFLLIKPITLTLARRTLLHISSYWEAIITLVLFA